jgi:hypothetical protein
MSYVTFHVEGNEIKENACPWKTVLPSQHIINPTSENHNERVYHRNKTRGTKGSYLLYPLEYLQRWIISFSRFVGLQHLLPLVHNTCKPSMVVIYNLHLLQSLYGCLLSFVDSLLLLPTICNNLFTLRL